MGEIAEDHKKIENYKRYLGDGAYVEFDGYNIVLTTSNGIVNTNTIALDPEIFDALIKYEKMLKQALIDESNKKQQDNG